MSIRSKSSTNEIPNSFKEQRFDCEKYVQLSDNDRKNLLLLKRFKQFKWFLLRAKLGKGKSIGHEALEGQDLERAQ